MLAALLLPLLALQDPASRPPLPEGVVARVGDRMITREEYLEYLWDRLGKRALRDYATDILVEQEAERYGIEVDAEAVRRQVEEQEQTARSQPRPTTLEEDLQRNGQSIEMFREAKAAEARRDLLLGALVRATRVVTDERVRQDFETQYGTGGVQLRVRHILVMPNVLKSEAIRAGKKPNEIDMDALKAQARRMAEEAAARVQAGGDFAAVAAEVSQDQTTREKGGELASYDGRLYGNAFREAVLALQPGQSSGVVESAAGFHVVQLVERTDTRLEDVRAALVEQILGSEPSWQEKQGLLGALQSNADLQLW